MSRCRASRCLLSKSDNVLSRSLIISVDGLGIFTGGLLGGIGKASLEALGFGDPHAVSISHAADKSNQCLLLSGIRLFGLMEFPFEGGQLLLQQQRSASLRGTINTQYLVPVLRDLVRVPEPQAGGDGTVDGKLPYESSWE